jgi:hypothetical protein
MDDEYPDDMPSGLPEEEVEAEEQPLGVQEADPDGEGGVPSGADAMPGIPTKGEPPSGG